MRYALMVAAFALISSPALAQQAEGWYVGAGLGMSEAKDACEGVLAGVNCDDSDTAMKFLAGYQFNRNLAVEGAYTDLGKARFSGPGGTIDFESSGFEVTVVGIAPLAPRWWLYGKAGLFLWDLDLKDGTGVVGNFSESGTELTYGFGVGFDFTKNVAGRIEYQVYPDIGDDVTTGTSDVTVLGANLIFRF